MTARWQVKSLGEILVKTETVDPTRYPDEEFVYIDVSSVSNETLSIREVQRLMGADAPSRARKRVRVNDVIFATIRPTLRRIAIVPKELDGEVCSTGYFVLRPKPEVDPRFVYYFLQTETFMLGMESLQKGASYPAVTDGDVRSQSIAFPSLSDQQRIVAILDEAFEGIANAKANAEKNLQNAKAIFEEHLRAVFANSGGAWAEKRLGDLCSRVSVGHVGPTSRYYCDAGIGIPFLRSQNVRPGRIDFDGLQYITPEFHRKLRKSILKPGDLLFVRVGANRGDCCVVPEGVGELNCANIVFARPEDELSEFVALYCRSEIGRQRLLGMTTGAAQGVINTGSVAELMVPLPNSNERKQITAQLDALASESQRVKALYEQKLAALDDLKNSLLHHAFSGQL